jgi:hypothetical protein
MALSVNSRGTIPLSSVAGTLFTPKLQTAVSSTQYPEGTVFDCSMYKNETLTATIKISRPGITLLFGEGDFTMIAPGLDMFDIQAPNVTIIGVSRSARDSVSTNGSTRFVMTNTNGGYHISAPPTGTNNWGSSDSLTIMNVDLVGVRSVYTSNNGTASFSTQGSGGILLTEGNPNVSGSNLNNVWINEVLIDGARRHGIMIYGGMACKIQNTRVRNAGGHGFYIAGSTTSTSLDTCYASGCHLAGFSIHDTSYSTLNNCASDSNGLGYWMRNANSVTMSSCGAETNQVRSSIPNTLGITLPSQTGTVTINDIGSDNVNFIKGTSFLFTGGENITGISCYSKDPGNRAGLSTYASKYTAHIHGVAGTTKVNMDNFKAAGTSTTKYLYRLEDVYNFHIDDLVNAYDPTNPTESPDGSMTFVAQILDQGGSNIFGDDAYSNSWTGRRVNIANSEAGEHVRVNQLNVPGRLSIPVEPAHPANPEAGSIYFNNTLNKLYMYSGSAWFDTCCVTGPTPAPECVFPNGGVQTAVLEEGSVIASLPQFYRIGNKVYIYCRTIYSSVTTEYVGNPSIIKLFDLDTGSLQTLVSINDLMYMNTTGYSVLSSGSSFTYSASTNSFYFTLLASGVNDESLQYLGSNQGIFKYSLDTNEIDASYILYNLDATQAADAYNIFAKTVNKLYAYENEIYVVNPGAYDDGTTQGANITQTTYSVNNLSYNDYLTGDPLTSYFFNVTGPENLEVNFKMLELGTKVIIAPRTLQGHEILLYDLSDGSTSTFVYNAAPVTGFLNYVLAVTPSLSGTTFFITDSFKQKVYEVEYDGFAIVAEWALGYAAGIVEKIINGKRIFFYKRVIYNNNNSLVTVGFAAYNATDSQYLGFIATSENNPVSSESFVGSVSLEPMLNGEPNDYIYILRNMNQVSKICAPYAV